MKYWRFAIYDVRFTIYDLRFMIKNGEKDDIQS